MKEFLIQINQDIKDIFDHDISTTKAYVVPTRNDHALTFTIGAEKQGKLLETCVLMVDIRNSTRISRRLIRDKAKLGKIYSAFGYAMTSIADKYGYVRNIVGDRVMVVFEPNNCFVNAVNCAALMHIVGNRILSKHVGLQEFQIGIGIEYGEMLVLKTGIRKKYNEQSEHKGLVWVGNPANIASKLCDMASKSYSSPVFKITYEKLNYKKVFKGYNYSPFNQSLMNVLSSLSNPEPEYEYIHSTEMHSANLNHSEFASSIVVGSDGWKYNGQKVKTFNFENRTGTTSPILMSGKVYNEYKKIEPKSAHLWRIVKKDYPDKPCYPLYGGSLIVPEYLEIRRELH